MSVHLIPAVPGATRAQYEATVHDAWDVASRELRACVIDWDQMALVFVPDLSAAEVTTLASIIAGVRSGTGLTTAEYAAIRTQMQVLRDLRQMTRATFVAQTQAQINRQLYDATVAVTEIFLKLTRDS